MLYFIQYDAEHVALLHGIFSTIFGTLVAEIFHFFSAEPMEVPFYTKRFENNNSDLVLRRQKKIGFSQLIPNFPEDMLGFKNLQDAPFNSASFGI